MIKKIIFLLFFVSGFCALLYQTIWLRLAFAAFGINAQVISIVISVFMLGLLLGSFFTGTKLLALARRRGIGSLYLYAGAEAGIGLGALVVPHLFNLGHKWLLSTGQTNSIAYLTLSALVLAFSILPWSILMGATIPLMMNFVNDQLSVDKNIFSYLYFANTAGAMLGTVLTAVVLIELLGFVNSLVAAAILNFIIAATAVVIARRSVERPSGLDAASATKFRFSNFNRKQKYIFGVLFTTGFTSLGLEVIWNRLFTPVLQTSVYAFAFILFLYLLGTCLGLFHYRFDLRKNRILPTAFLLLILVTSCILQIWLNDPRTNFSIAGVVLTILLISYVLGYLTPKQVDELSEGNPGIASIAYSVNILGCIIGPLVASYILLPLIGSKIAILLLTLPLGLFLIKREEVASPLSFEPRQVLVILAIFFILTGWFGLTFEEALNAKDKVIKYDYNATVVGMSADPEQTRSKNLVVNGVQMTVLTPITKIMAHLSLALEQGHPQKALVICLGMGTTFRSVSSWGIDTTAVELTPSVKELFPYFFSDAKTILDDPKHRIVIDDGRRYLERTPSKYDLIVIDPPPPIYAAGSSLLYSQEFYVAAKNHLTDNGILAQWYPSEQGKTLQAVTRSLLEVFPYVQAYQSTEGWGYHFMAAMHPIPTITAQQFVAAMPADAQKDLMEWNDHNDPDITSYVTRILAGKKDILDFLNPDKKIMVSDDQPYNEYFLLRDHGKFKID